MNSFIIRGICRGIRFDCREDSELEARYLSFEFLNDKFGDWSPFVQSVLEEMSKRDSSSKCTPNFKPAVED